MATIILCFTFFIWLIIASVLALDVALPKMERVKIRARRGNRRR
jgi:hypothetical protein